MTIFAALHHSLTIHQVSAHSDENCRKSYPETYHYCKIFKVLQLRWKLVNRNLMIICAAPGHDLTSYQDSALSDENCTRSYPGTPQHGEIMEKYSKCDNSAKIDEP